MNNKNLCWHKNVKRILKVHEEQPIFVTPSLSLMTKYKLIIHVMEDVIYAWSFCFQKVTFNVFHTNNFQINLFSTQIICREVQLFCFLKFLLHWILLQMLKTRVGSTKPHLSNYKSHTKRRTWHCGIGNHFIYASSDIDDSSKYITY